MSNNKVNNVVDNGTTENGALETMRSLYTTYAGFNRVWFEGHDDYTDEPCPDNLYKIEGDTQWALDLYGHAILIFDGERVYVDRNSYEARTGGLLNSVCIKNHITFSTAPIAISVDGEHFYFHYQGMVCAVEYHRM